MGTSSPVILVVNDEFHTRSVLSRILKQAEYKVITSPDHTKVFGSKKVPFFTIGGKPAWLF